MKVLIVEDNPYNLKLLNIVFRRHGDRTIEAKSGVEGVNKALKEHPDLIIMDILLPDFSGVEATKRIRGHKELRKIPIIAITSLAMAGDRELIMKAGCNGYFEKPINPLTLMDEIDNIIKAA